MSSWRKIVAAALVMSIAILAGGRTFAESSKVRVYVGTYTGGKSISKGIYVIDFDPSTGRLGAPELAGEVNSPSFLTIHPSGQFLYAVSEAGKSGVVSAFSITPETGKLTLLNQQPSGGNGPCYVGLDPAGKAALIANYGSGSFESLMVGSDGKLGAPVSVIQDEGSGPNAARQKGPHAHSINTDPAGRFAFAADLGLDKLFIFKLNPATAALTPNEPAYAMLAPGAGPRHFTFHPSGKFAYVINEMACTVTAFSYEPEKGALTQLQTIGTLPDDFKGNNTTAEVQVHPSGKFLYGSNRGHDSIALFEVDPQTGKLTAKGQTPSGGKTPRNFRIDPSGNYLLAAHQDSDSIVVFKIDPQTGSLTPTGQKVEVGKPVCLKFLAGR